MGVLRAHRDRRRYHPARFGRIGLFAQNAQALGIDLSDVDYCVLSHAHYDHADGFGDFFAINDHAPLLIQDACEEVC